MLYVINERREIESPEETAQMLKDIERRCKLEATGVVNNTHLSEETTLSVVERIGSFRGKDRLPARASHRVHRRTRPLCAAGACRPSIPR